MAIHTDYPGLKVEIVVNGQPLPEYDDETNTADSNVVTKYVEAESGAEFSINYSFDKTFPTSHDVNVRCSLDGRQVRKPRVGRTKLLCERGQKITGLRVQEGKSWGLKRFRFSDLVVVDGHDVDISDGLTEIMKLLGTVEIVFRFGTISNIRQARRTRESLCSPLQVPEAALKGDAKSLQIGLGSYEETKTPTTCLFEPIEAGSFATFVFKYRSRANLQALHVIPCDLSPTPIDEDKSSLGLPPPLNPEAEAQEKTIIRPSPITIPDEQNAPQPSPAPRLQSSTPGLRLQDSRTSQASQIVQQQHYSIPTRPACNGLNKRDLLILIKHYRGTSAGLESLPEKDLAILLESYRNEEVGETPIKRETVGGVDGVLVKRERDEGVAARGGEKKRRTEVIVLDD